MAKEKNTPQTVTFRIQRAERIKGKLKTYTEEFAVPYDASTTLLQGLEQIKGAQDGSLTFRRSCRASICGSCAMVVNNRTRLACKTKITDIVNGSAERGRLPQAVIEIAPQKNQPVIKDLVVDIRSFFGKVKAITPYVQEGPETDKKVDKKSYEQVNMVSNCIMCASCYSDCAQMAVNGEFLGPAALAKAYRFVADPREGQKTARLKKLSEENGIWDCTRCGLCVDACPKGVAPMEAIVKLRNRALKSGVTDNPGARHALAFKADIAKYGVLNEPMLLVKTLGLGVFGQMGNALHLARRGKIPEIFPEKVENVEEIRRIYEELEKHPIDAETKALDTGPGAG